jgi:predicted alpha-1,2-mannosidase
LLVAAAGCAPELPLAEKPTQYVNPFMGSGGFAYAAGNAFPGASVPMGMVKVGPDTTGKFGTLLFLHFDGYWYDDDTVQGFSHLHLSGTGASDYGVLSVMPTDAFDATRTKPEGYQSRFRKANEVATPGYYATTLERGKVRVELAATGHGAYHRYTFAPGTARSFVLFDLDKHLGGGSVKDAEVSVSGAEARLRGKFRSMGAMSDGFGGTDVYFEARAKAAWVGAQVWSNGAAPAPGDRASGEGVGVALEFDTSSGEPVELQVGVSFVSAEGAAANLAAELPDWDFDAAHARAETAWSETLSAVKVYGGTEGQRRLFFSSLHHAFVMPSVVSDVDGRYLGHDRQVHQAEGFSYLTDLSLWDTYRTAHPLYHLLAPERGRDAVRSLTQMAIEGGRFPKWPLGAGDSGSMIGAGAEVVIADAYLRGVTGFDAAGAYALLRAAALGEVAPPGGRGGRESVEAYDRLGYVPASRSGSVSLTTEFAQDDFALGNLAAALGETADAERLQARSVGYRKLFDGASGFLRSRKDDGSLDAAAFDPLVWSDGYVEANAWQTLWAPAYDIDGLAELLGGRAAAVDRLTEFFEKAKAEHEAQNPDDLLGSNLPGTYYWAGNEPDIQTPYMFAQLGRPDLTQQWARWALTTFFSASPAGLPGNDDGGAMTSWVVFSALGLYPLPGSDRYLIGSPLFPKTVLKLRAGEFTIEATDASEANLFVQSAELNGRALETAGLRQADLKAGGKLLLRMGPKPSRWGQR